MNRLRKNLKMLVIDMVGVLLIVAAVLFGWIPGPGGIPLLIGGLGLLSINHEWAKRWINKVEKHGLHLSEKVFRDSKIWKRSLDVIGLIIVCFGMWLFTSATRNYLYALALSLSCLGLILLLGNRKRLRRFMSSIKAQAK